MSSTEATEFLSHSTNECLIRYVEVWIPNENGTLLELSGRENVKPDIHRTTSTAQVAAVRSGEGIAGAAWHQKSATILQEEPSNLLQQISTEAGTQLTAVVAIPIFRQQEIRGVVVLGLSDAYGEAEIWSRDDRDELTVTSAHYSGLPSFEFITRYTRFPKGAGVPGKVWTTGEPKLAQNLETSSTFIRSFGNDPAVITSAIGMPIASTHGFPSSILMLLGTAESPLAQQTEVWTCETHAAGMESDPPTTTIRSSTAIGTSETTSLKDWQLAIMKKVSDFKRPVLTDAASGSLPKNATFHLAVPIFRSAEIIGVVNFMF